MSPAMGQAIGASRLQRVPLGRRTFWLIVPALVLIGVFLVLPYLNIVVMSLREPAVGAPYGAGLTLHVFHWMHWQNRSKTKAAVVPTTAYGRPLARKG